MTDQTGPFRTITICHGGDEQHDLHTRYCVPLAEQLDGTRTLTEEQAWTFAENAIGLFLENRDQHAMTEDRAAEVAAGEIVDDLFTGIPEEPGGISEYAEQRARLERQRTLTDARAVVQRLTAAYADASGTAGAPLGILAGFDQWALAEYHTLADPDRRLCPECGQRHTDYEHGDAHRNPEGGH